MTRTHLKHFRTYVNGYDLSGYSRSIGSLDWTFGAEPDAALTDSVKNILIGQGDIMAGPLSAFLDNDTAGLFSLQAQTERNYMVVMGANAEPAAGDPVFAWKFQDTGYMAEQGTGFVAATLPFGGASSQGVVTYKKPWGFLLHAKAARTAVNSSTGLDDSGASSTLGGVFAYHIFSSNGTVTVKCQHASTNSDGSFADLTLATSGSVNASSTPQSGLVALSTSLTINRYTRWQISFGTATTVSFCAALIRNTIA